MDAAPGATLVRGRPRALVRLCVTVGSSLLCVAVYTSLQMSSRLCLTCPTHCTSASVTSQSVSEHRSGTGAVALQAVWVMLLYVPSPHGVTDHPARRYDGMKAAIHSAAASGSLEAVRLIGTLPLASRLSRASHYLHVHTVALFYRTASLVACRLYGLMYLLPCCLSADVCICVSVSRCEPSHRRRHLRRYMFTQGLRHRRLAPRGHQVSRVVGPT
jgi:hypothetical protein